jgi:hypothetical protein
MSDDVTNERPKFLPQSNCTLNMKLLAALGLSAILLAQSAAGAWTWTWREPNNTPHVVRGTGNKGCTGINHGRGKVFDWDRSSDSNCCIRMWTNGNCNGDTAGFSCSDWRNHVSSVDLLSYRVTNC